jgi:hypothetical protein
MLKKKIVRSIRIPAPVQLTGLWLYLRPIMMYPDGQYVERSIIYHEYKRTCGYSKATRSLREALKERQKSEAKMKRTSRKSYQISTLELPI